MKKIILAAAIVLTTGVLVVTNTNNVKTNKTITTATTFDKNVTATAD